MVFEPAYQRLLKAGELQERARLAGMHLEDCDLCARYCHVNRRLPIEGAVCRIGDRVVVNSYGPHHGEEDPLRGWRGSGTIFLSWCNLRCVYCQNWEISHKGMGHEVTASGLADIMLMLQGQGCHNINFVTPSHAVAQILAAVVDAAQRGLNLPLVYNTGGYDSPEALALLDGVIDIYMPDMKYGDSKMAVRHSKVRDYAEVNRAAVREMHRQVGDLIIDKDGIAHRGLLVRHLVLPHNLAGTEQVMAFLSGEVSADTYINLMDQYRPCYRADQYPHLKRSLVEHEYQESLEVCAKYGLWRLDQRAKSSWRLFGL